MFVACNFLFCMLYFSSINFWTWGPPSTHLLYSTVRPRFVSVFPAQSPWGFPAPAAVTRKSLDILSLPVTEEAPPTFVSAVRLGTDCYICYICGGCPPFLSTAVGWFFASFHFSAYDFHGSLLLLPVILEEVSFLPWVRLFPPCWGSIVQDPSVCQAVAVLWVARSQMSAPPAAWSGVWSAYLPSSWS